MQLKLVIPAVAVAAASQLFAQQQPATAATPRTMAHAAQHPCGAMRDSTMNHEAMDHQAGNHQARDHGTNSSRPGDCETTPMSAGQAAFATIGEVVRLLKADPATDWSRVNIEALRQHLIDMDEVTLHSVVAQRNVAGGAEFDVTGTGRAAAAIKRIAVNHANSLSQGSEYVASARTLPNGARLTFTARNATDSQTVARIRGLGFAGLMTEGSHHAPHHLALARGSSDPHGHR